VQSVFEAVFDIRGSYEKGRESIDMARSIDISLTFRSLATELVDPDKPGHFNQAVMVRLCPIDLIS